MAPPSLSDAEVQALFDRANSLTDQAGTVALYRDWAPVYDATLTRFGAYLSPPAIAARLVACGLDPMAPILDVACGTGLVGAALAARGFTNLTGLDLSAPMLDQAAAKGCYRHLIQADLMRPADLPAPGFAAVVCGGALTLGHLGLPALDPMLACLRPGGWLVADVEGGTHADQGFAPWIAARLGDGRLTRADSREVHFYAPAPDEPPHGWLIALQTAAAPPPG